MSDPVVELIRRFVPTSPELGDWDFVTARGGKPKRWHELTDARRVLILADPGAGKTFEGLARARAIRAGGGKAFFIRIEAIDANFDNAFEVGTAAEFAEWLASTEEAWFFLDSVDEAQLETPRALEDAIRIFGGRIRDARERAHIFITSRHDAWQALPDRTLVEQYLPYGAPEAGEGENAGKSPVLEAYRLTGLNSDEIKLFAGYYGVGDVNAFVDAIDRGGLLGLAERPFDHKALIRKWQADGALGSRFEVLTRIIELQLVPPSAAFATSKISPTRAREGARMLAAAVTLSGKNVICLPDGVQSEDRIDPAKALPGWSPREIDVLLHTGLFDDIVYTSVRFRHREIRELLTAEWAHEILGQPDGRDRIEALFFRERYGEQVLVPRLRSTLTWLILFDEAIRDRALAIEPEVASEGGDPSQLPLNVRKDMLAAIVERIVDGRD
jgi:hypothetical protein